MKKRAGNGHGLATTGLSCKPSSVITNTPLSPVKYAQAATDCVANKRSTAIQVSADEVGESAESGDSLNLYLRQMRDTELFTAKEEFELSLIHI